MGDAMGWLTNKIGNWALETQRREIASFVTNMRAMDGAEIGLVAACANHQRLLILEAKGWDLRYPALLADHPANVPLVIGNVIRDLQRQGKQPLAAGMMVWLHTVRSMQWLELRQLGRDMWGELARGFPYVEESANSFFELTGYRFETDDACDFPDGLSPMPR